MAPQAFKEEAHGGTHCVLVPGSLWRAIVCEGAEWGKGSTYVLMFGRKVPTAKGWPGVGGGDVFWVAGRNC